jgi:hypothetical protein
MQAPKVGALGEIVENPDDYVVTPAGRVASQVNFADDKSNNALPDNLFLDLGDSMNGDGLLDDDGPYELGDSLLGPADVAILLQAGLTSAMKSSTVVQLNQRMLLDLIATQPRSFAIAVLAEIGNNGGQGSPRGLTSALMALLELDQSSFMPVNRLEMHHLLESWLPGFKVPRREDYMAGGRWARQSYYEALFSVAKGILEDAECYMALKSHIQRDRKHTEKDAVPEPREFKEKSNAIDLGLDLSERDGNVLQKSKLVVAVETARGKILEADRMGYSVFDKLIRDEGEAKRSREYPVAIQAYQEAFQACAYVLDLDKLAFQAEWFREFYRRNFDALMILSMHSNVMEDIDNVRHWFSALRRGSSAQTTSQTGHPLLHREKSVDTPADLSMDLAPPNPGSRDKNILEHVGDFVFNFGKPSPEQRLAELEGVDVFVCPEKYGEQTLVDAIIDAIIYREKDRERLKNDPLVRLLIPNPPGKYNFAIVSAMGVITEGERGKELEVAFQRLKRQRGVDVVRSDTGTARSFEYNVSSIYYAVIFVDFFALAVSNTLFEGGQNH